MFKRFIVLIGLSLGMFFAAGPGFPGQTLELTLKVEEEIYEVGDEIIIELIWENKGKEPVYFIPWGGEWAVNWVKIKDKTGVYMEGVRIHKYDLKLYPEKNDYILLKTVKSEPLNRYTEKRKGVIKKEKIRLRDEKKPIERIFIDFEDSIILLKAFDAYSIFAEYSNSYNTYLTGMKEKPLKGWIGRTESGLLRFIVVDKAKSKYKTKIDDIRAITIASKRAKQFGYHIKKMKISAVTVAKDKFWKVCFSYLTPQKGKGLTIYVGAKDATIRYVTLDR